MGGVVVDKLLYRFSICESFPEIFAIKVESCQKSRKILDDFLALRCDPEVVTVLGNDGFTRDSIKIICYSAYMPRQFRLSVRLSVRLSITRVYFVKTAERIIEILLPSDRPIILVFCHQGSFCKSEGVTPNGGAKYQGVAIFDQYAATVYLENGKR